MQRFSCSVSEESETTDKTERKNEIHFLHSISTPYYLTCAGSADPFELIRKPAIKGVAEWKQIVTLFRNLIEDNRTSKKGYTE
uniref:Uncharacterized protein n=1 Tax=Heterorhabditis bacteriophora TaxID=37862 RepID=A0A1I7XDC5_HETBA